MEREQYIINYHSSGSQMPDADNIKKGEIAITHADKASSTIYTKVEDGSLAKFITEDAINTKLDEYKTLIYGKTNEEGEHQNGLLDEIELLKKQIEDLTKGETEINGVYKIKEGVATFEDLPMSGNTKGDARNVGDSESGINYVWDGEKWDSMGATLATDKEVDDAIDEIFKQ